MNYTAIAQKLNIAETAIFEIQEWANVLWVKFVGGCRFVSKSINQITGDKVDISLEKIQELLGDPQAIDRKIITNQTVEAAKEVAKSLYGYKPHNGSVDFSANYAILDAIASKYNFKSKQMHAVDLAASWMLSN